MITLVKTLSSRAVSGRKQILVRVNLSRTFRPRLKTGIYVDPRFFIGGDVVVAPMRGIRRTPDELDDATKTKERLDQYCEVIQGIVSASAGHIELTAELLQKAIKAYFEGTLIRRNGLFQYNDIRNLLCKEDDAEESKPLYSYIDAYCIAHNCSESRKRSYSVLKRILVRFELFESMTGTDRNFKFTDKHISTEVIRAFKEYVKAEPQLAEHFPKLFKSIIEKSYELLPGETTKTQLNVNRCDSTCANILKQMSALVKWLIKEMGFDAKAHYCIGDVMPVEYNVKPIFLTIEERNKIADFDMSDDSHLSVQRDIFIFQCLTGCRYGDLVSLTSSNIINGVLEYIPQKTSRCKDRVKPRIPLSQKATELIAKYDGIDKDGRLFPFLKRDAYNLNVKRILSKVGITRFVYIFNPKTNEIDHRPINEVATTHIGRKTFVASAYKVTKDPLIVSSMSGHVENSKAFLRYRDIDDADRLDVINMID